MSIRCPKPGEVISSSSDNRVDNGTYDYEGGDCSSWGRQKELKEKMSLAQKIVKYWMDNGFTKYQAVAAAGVAFHESGYKTGVLNKSSKATGLFQWMPQYHKKFIEYADYPANTVIANLTFEQQMDFAMKILKSDKGSNKTYLSLIKATGNLLDAVYAYTCYICWPNDNSYKSPRTKENGATAAMNAGGKLYQYTCPAKMIFNYV